MDDAQSRKRKAEDEPTGSRKAALKSSKKWQTPKKGQGERDVPRETRASIEVGDEGIWATCDRGREGKCVGELRDLLQQYAVKLYPELESRDSAPSATDDVEASIQAELNDMRNSKQSSKFQSVKLDVQCVLFFKTTSPINPVQLVHRICLDASISSSSTTEHRKGRWIKRLTPTTLIGRASEAGLEDVARKVLAPYFHEESVSSKKFAIRPTIRNHSILTRETIIKKVASVVGPGHSVDLKSYNVLILVEVYKNICGISVVGSDFDDLKRYNLAEIDHPAQRVTSAVDAEEPPSG